MIRTHVPVADAPVTMASNCSQIRHSGLIRVAGNPSLQQKWIVVNFPIKWLQVSHPGHH